MKPIKDVSYWRQRMVYLNLIPQEIIEEASSSKLQCFMETKITFIHNTHHADSFNMSTCITNINEQEHVQIQQYNT